MKKLKLDLDQLAVESFAATDPEPPRGTVKGYYTAPADGCVGSEYPPECYSNNVTYCAGCDYTAEWSNCHNTCYAQTCFSCAGTCGSCIRTCGETCFGEYSCDCPSIGYSYCETCSVAVC